MATYNYKAGLGNVGSYQVSGVPWVSGSVNPAVLPNARIDFPSVTSWVVVKNNSVQACKFAFSANGLAGSNYFTVGPTGSSGRLDLKITQLHLGGSATDIDICAGLTGISSLDINNSSVSPSGSNWSGSVGALVG